MHDSRTPSATVGIEKKTVLCNLGLLAVDLSTRPSARTRTARNAFAQLTISTNQQCDGDLFTHGGLRSGLETQQKAW